MCARTVDAVYAISSPDTEDALRHRTGRALWSFVYAVYAVYAISSVFRALCCARAALRAASRQRIQYAQLLFLLWLAIAIMLACVQVVA